MTTVGSIAPPAIVAPAPRTGLSFGLFSVVSFRPGADRWESGVVFETLNTEAADGIGPWTDADEPSPVGLPKVLDTTYDIGAASQFTVYGHFACSPVGFDAEHSQGRANAHLLAREEARVEQAFWTGDLGNVPQLRTGSSVVEATGVDWLTAIGALENFNATYYGSTGIIHMTRQGAMAGFAAHGLAVKGGSLTTGLGTPVVAGAGYDGSSPLGAAPAAGTSWAYCSPAIFGYRSEVFTSSNRPGDLLDRGINMMYAVAERNYLLGYDPDGVGAALIKLP